MPHNFAQRLDDFFIRTFGLPYLRLVRDPLIHERSEYLVSHIKKMNRARLRILDVGCGAAMPLLYMNEFCRQTIDDYVGIDLHIERLGERYESIQLPHKFYNVNLDADWNIGKFDVVCCFEVIEHLTNDSRLFRLLCSQVAEAGCLLVTTPSKDFITKMARCFPGFDKVSAVQDGGHVRIGYSIQDFQLLADRNGMQILSCGWLSRFDVQGLAAYLGRKGVLGTLLHNLRNPRRENEVKFRPCREPHESEDSYYCIAACFGKRTG